MAKEDGFVRWYPKGEIVRARKNSLGIFVFTSYEDAARFAGYTWTIIKVRPVGRRRVPRVMVRWDVLTSKTHRQLVYLLKKDEPWVEYRMQCGSKYFNLSSRIPRGTVCYPAVEVLE